LETNPFYGGGPNARSNENYGKPLSKHQFERTLLFVGRRYNNEDDAPEVWHVKATQDNAASANVRLWEIGVFNINPPSENATTDKGKKTLYINKAFTQQQYDTEAEFENPVDTLKAQSNWTTLAGLETYLDTTRGRDWCAVRAFVQDFNKNPREGNSASITLDDPLYDTGDRDENPIVWLGDQIASTAFRYMSDNGWADYSVGSVIIVVGRPYRRQRKEDGQVIPGEYFPATIEPWGVWAMPEYAIPAETTESFTTDDFKDDSEETEEQETD
jgi:hypothetical protein